MLFDSHINIDLSNFSPNLTLPNFLVGGVLWSDYFPTVIFAKLLSTLFKREFKGSLILNEYVGGFNLKLVEYVISRGCKIISMPTLSAWWFKHFHGSAGGYVIYSLDGKIRGEVIDLLYTLAENNCVLCTGFLAYGEIRRLIEEADATGISRVVVLDIMNPVMRDVYERIHELAKYNHIFFEVRLSSVKDVDTLIHILSHLRSVLDEHRILLSSGSGIDALNSYWPKILSRLKSYFNERFVSLITFENQRDCFG